jgi:hypothetical protein
MSAWQKACKFWYHLLCFVILVLSVLILGVILFWTLEHTDIVAFVTVLLAAAILEAILILSLSGNPNSCCTRNASDWRNRVVDLSLTEGVC